MQSQQLHLNQTHQYKDEDDVFGYIPASCRRESEQTGISHLQKGTVGGKETTGAMAGAVGLAREGFFPARGLGRFPSTEC